MFISTLLVLSGCVFCATDCFSVTWMKWMWSSVRESCVSSLSLLFRSAISWPRRSMWPSAVLSAAFLLVEMSLVISCCILSMEWSMSPNSFSLSCKARCAELWKNNCNQYSIFNSASFSFLEMQNFYILYTHLFTKHSCFFPSKNWSHQSIPINISMQHILAYQRINVDLVLFSHIIYYFLLLLIYCFIITWHI